MSGTTRRRGSGLAGRLLVAQLLVVVTAVVTAWLIAAAVGPTIFHDHLSRVPHDDSPQLAQLHAEQAFRDASVLSTGVAILVALVVAVLVSAWITRRIVRPVTTLAAAAGDVAAGRYDVAVPRPALGQEFDRLADSFAAMAAQLRSVEATRRRLLGDLAHEMRTPVATLDAYLEGVEDGVAHLDPETVAMLRTQTRRLSRLAEDVNAVSRAEEHRLELHRAPRAPRELIAAAVDAAQDRFTAAGVRLIPQGSEPLPDVDADADRMGQVLGNLLDNALRHTAPGGSVTIAALAGSDGVHLSVSDTGEGIAAEHLPHVFERFYRVDTARDRAHGGSGIGLAIVKALVEAHGGTVEAHSEGPGHGSTFTVHLPVTRSITQNGGKPARTSRY